MYSNLGVLEEEDRQALEAQLVHTRKKGKKLCQHLIKKITSRSFKSKQTLKVGRISTLSTVYTFLPPVKNMIF